MTPKMKAETKEKATRKSEGRILDAVFSFRTSGLVASILVLPAVYRLFQSAPFDSLAPGLGALNPFGASKVPRVFEVNDTAKDIHVSGPEASDHTDSIVNAPANVSIAEDGQAETKDEAERPDVDYKVQIITHDPLTVYLERFVTAEERKELITACDDAGLWSRSTVLESGGDPSKSKTEDYRTSYSCFLPMDAPITSVIGARAMHFLGFLPYIGLEQLQLVKYDETQEFRTHVDQFTIPSRDPRHKGRFYNRLASFFVYLEDNCTDGQTYFPRLEAPPEHERGDKFASSSKYGGFAVNPIAGNGVFWMGLTEDDEPDQRTLHAGLPVTKGRKVGMNIWVRKLVDWTEEQEQERLAALRGDHGHEEQEQEDPDDNQAQDPVAVANEEHTSSDGPAEQSEDVNVSGADDDGQAVKTPEPEHKDDSKQNDQDVTQDQSTASSRQSTFLDDTVLDQLNKDLNGED